jgi:hypothetical protein
MRRGPPREQTRRIYACLSNLARASRLAAADPTLPLSEREVVRGGGVKWDPSAAPARQSYR